MPADKIVVNGDERELARDQTIESSLIALGLDPRIVAVERDGALVRRPAFASTRLAADDRLEIVRFVQGG